MCMNGVGYVPGLNIKPGDDAEYNRPPCNHSIINTLPAYPLRNCPDFAPWPPKIADGCDGLALDTGITQRSNGIPLE